MSDEEFRKIGEFIQSSFGIRMPDKKKTLLTSRLGKRLRSLGMSSYREYRDYLFSPEGMEAEVPHLLDAVTTNKTEFFREKRHFDILAEKIIPAWLEACRPRTLKIWSAGCSTGEEPYTAAMVLADCLEGSSGWDFEILATDLSGKVLDIASKAVYPEKKAGEIPFNLRKKYLMRSRDRKKALVRVVPEIRERVNFRQLNLMEDFRFRERMDLIFCRNVVIYFEKPVQEALVKKLADSMIRGGYLFIGHSESLSGRDLPLVRYKPTIYRRTD